VATRSGDTWTLQATLVGTDSSGMVSFGDQGLAVAVSGDGNTAVVIGTPTEQPAMAWVFFRSTDGTWSQQAILPGGASAALSKDGNIAIIGNADGAVVYERSTSGWSQETTMPGTGSPGNAGDQEFNALVGFAVALSGDGETAMVGTSVFRHSDDRWIQQVLGNDGAAPVALSGDGHTAIIGRTVYSEYVFPGTPGKSNCYGQRTAGLAQQYGGLNNAVAALGFDSVSALQEAIMAFCKQ
jgi:hypothetical protein